MSQGRKKICFEECQENKKQKLLPSPQARHRNLLRILEQERVPKTDLLWSENFYSALLDFNGFTCLTCQQPLSKSGHGLDRIVNRLGHRCFNVVPACSVCNRIKSDSKEDGFSFEE